LKLADIGIKTIFHTKPNLTNLIYRIMYVKVGGNKTLCNAVHTLVKRGNISMFALTLFLAR
jgi:hypothetical protein